MKPNSFRLTEVDLINVKNVERGHLNFLSPRGLQKASLLGLYGQNGSGKTALINSLGLLKKLLSGESLPQENSQLIELGKKYASLTSNLIYQQVNTVIEFSIHSKYGFINNR